MKYEKLDLVQGSVEWLNARFDHYTASRAGCVDNVYPYQTLLQYATEILKRETREESGKEHIFAHGHAVEKAGREWAISNLGIEITPLVVRSNELRCLLASLDGADEKKGIGFEAKYMGRDALADVKRGVLKPHHEYQVQAQLLATGFDRFIYFAMDPDGEAAVMDITPNPEIQARLKSGIAVFWDNLKAGILPEPCNRDIIEVNDPQLSMLAELDAKLSAIKKEYDSLEEVVLARYADKPRVQGAGVTITQSYRKGNVDYSKVPQLKGVDLDRFRKSGTLVTSVKFRRGA